MLGYFYLIPLGFLIGSFLNMLIDRLPREEQIWKGRSHCDACNHPLYWYDLIPVLSWIYLRGRCRYCRNSVPSRNTIVEIVTALLFTLNYSILYSYFYASYSPILFWLIVGFQSVILASFVAIFFIDLKHYIIPDSLNIFAGFCSVILIVLYYFSNISNFEVMNYFWSALGASLFFAFLVLITKGRGMGIGDVKFALVMGLFLGYPRTVQALYFAFLTGAMVSVILIVAHKKRFGQKVPFGPFLVAGTIIAHLGFLNGIWKMVMPF